jgi:hypothetical protein
MKKLLALLGVILSLSGCGTPLANYKGANAGTLVLSIGYTEPSTDYYLMFYRPVGSAGPDADYVSIHTSSDIFRVLDYTGADTGSVVTEHLPPGTYEFYKVTASGQGGDVHYSKHVFSLPFVIKPGATTYLGSYTAMLVTEKSHSWLVGDYDATGGVYFVVSDQHDRDLEIARKREPNLPAAGVAVPQARALPAPYFTTKKVD